jgi:hypothetical protein
MEGNMKTTLRGDRQYHKQRMNKRCAMIYPDWKKSPHMGDTRKPCSRYCCGNPRKWFKQKRIAERRQDEAFRLQSVALDA